MRWKESGMIDRIKEIIAFLIDPEEFADHEFEEVHDTLLGMGYSDEEIQNALRMLAFDRDVEDRTETAGLVTNVRVLSEDERSMLSTDAHGHLLMLRRLGWISEVQLSLIIESAALEYSHPISLDEIKDISSRFVSDLPDSMTHEQYPRIDKTH
ncbi:MAG TPA: DUF494 family protein [Candidatus Eisenbacteria bacterium]|uniref:DUF494 family protein n=1 Tax=Eiseniibacteriota bacterium TaxID=2212470 RepID=A0A7V2F318_UNCEI|nr:DUF494 family protein [Candidatus Eisenbacteria bacterium]